jgi:transglycosylase-like protein with SLT domain
MFKPSSVLGALAPALALIALVFCSSALAAAAPVPCQSIGAGKYNCYFYPAGNGFSGGAKVQSSSGTTVGYLNQGENYVFCQSKGASVSSGAYTNHWWAYTIADNNKYGWVNAVYAQGGDNDGQFGGGVPACGSAHGYPPGGAPSAPPAPPPPPAPPASGAKPVPCSAIGGAKYSCKWFTPGDGTSGGTPVVSSGDSTVGFLNYGSNWISCQQAGAEQTHSRYHNKWWGYTEADNGSYGWANAVYASGGDNDGPFSGAPSCHGAHGSPPATAAAPPSAPPSTGGGSTSSSCSDSTGSGDNVTRWDPVVICVLKKLGAYSTDNVKAVDIVIANESSGNPTAVNRTDSNAQAGHPSEGLVQTIQSTFEGNRCSGLPDDIFDPAANICAGMAYAIHRYGSIADIPGVVAVRNGGSYVGYYGKVRPAGALTACGQVSESKSLRLSVSSRKLRCARARTVARTVEHSGVLRRWLRHHARSRKGLQIRTRYGRFSCQVERGRMGAAQRAVACARRREHVSWVAFKP